MAELAGHRLQPDDPSAILAADRHVQQHHGQQWVPRGGMGSLWRALAAETYTITPTAGANGSIVPDTPVTLYAGQSTSFVVSAAPDYYIASLTTNGAEERGVAGLYAYTSWWNNVQADGALTAAFASVTSDTATNGTSDALVAPVLYE